MYRERLQCAAHTMMGSVARARPALWGLAAVVLLTSTYAGAQAFKEVNGQVVM